MYLTFRLLILELVWFYSKCWIEVCLMISTGAFQLEKKYVSHSYIQGFNSPPTYLFFSLLTTIIILCYNVIGNSHVLERYVTCLLIHSSFTGQCLSCYKIWWSGTGNQGLQNFSSCIQVCWVTFWFVSTHR